MNKINESDVIINKIKEDSDGPMILYISSSEWDSGAIEICSKVEGSTRNSFSLYEVAVRNWDRMLTPWPVSGCMEGREFAGCAAELLMWLEDRFTEERREGRIIYVAGYSLAGLFALWSLYESDIFEGAICCSGSLWYPGWIEYAEKTEFTRNVRVYLSLGRKEPMTRNQIMSKVGEVTERQYELMRSMDNVDDIIFEWNEGGHFTEVSERMARGIAQLLNSGQ